MNEETTPTTMQYCADCGTQYSRRAVTCPKCGAPSPLAPAKSDKSRVTYVVLGFLLGGFGVHNFYSGHTGKGIVKIILTILIFTAPISGLLALIEICTVTKDADGLPFN